MTVTGEKTKAIERHAHSALLTAILLGLGWMITTLIGVDKRTAIIETQMSQLYAQIGSSYSAAAAQRDHSDVSRRLDQLDVRFERIESRVEKIERAQPQPRR